MDYWENNLSINQANVKLINRINTIARLTILTVLIPVTEPPLTDALSRAALVLRHETTRQIAKLLVVFVLAVGFSVTEQVKRLAFSVTALERALRAATTVFLVCPVQTITNAVTNETRWNAPLIGTLMVSKGKKTSPTTQTS